MVQCQRTSDIGSEMKIMKAHAIERHDRCVRSKEDHFIPLLPNT